MNKILIFDFDGTIADTRAVYYEAMKDELRIFGYKENDIDKAIDIGLSLRKTLKKLGLSFIVSYFLHKKILKRIKKYIDEVKKCKDADAIKNIKGNKILITNSLKEFAIPILKHLRLRKNFSEIYGADEFDDKEEFIKSYLRKNKIDKKECYYIGDRAADAKLARDVGCKSIIVTGKCAWDSRKEIMEAKPDFIVDDIRDVGEII